VTQPSPVGILGGTFDPIHYGHLRSAYELFRGLRLSEVRFIPSARPPHRREPGTQPDLRLAMVEAAVQGVNGFVADARELQREGPSYTVPTLAELRAELPAAPLCMIVGLDAFLGLDRWFRWQQIFELAHVVVAIRPGFALPKQGSIAELLAERSTDNVEDLGRTTHGRIFVREVTQLAISSSAIRKHLRAGGDARYLLPEAVRKIIQETECYAPSKTG
jgi:nicotinate-nucleotide adenylyltransferase